MTDVAGATTEDRPPPARRRFSWNIVGRAVLGALSFVALLPAAFAVLGGLFPNIPVFGVFGLVLNTGFAWVFGDLVGSAVFAVAVIWIGGRKAVVLLIAVLVILGGAGFIGYRYASFAAANGASYDVGRSIDGFPPIPEPDANVVFATVDGVALHVDLWLPGVAPSAAAASMAAVVFVHGGAFQGGGPGTRPLLMGAIKEAGIVGLDIDYRLAPPPRWDQAPADVLCALAWVRSDPALRVVDPKRVVLVGESAGGSLALVAGYAAGTSAITSSCPELGAPVVPAGVFAIAPTADLQGIWDDATITDYAGTRFPEAYIGGPPSAYPERYEAAEPYRLLRADLPPTVILGGEIDRLVHVGRLTSLADRIRAAGADIQLLIAPFAGHGFDGEPNSFGDQLVETLVPRFVRSMSEQ